MKFEEINKGFNPISFKITFESELELQQFYRILDSSDDQLNSLINDEEFKLDSNNNKWVDTLSRILGDYV